MVAPDVGETIYDPAFGTCGFLTRALEYIREKYEGGRCLRREDRDFLRAKAFWSHEVNRRTYRMGLLNMYLYGVDEPNLERIDTLGPGTHVGQTYDVVLSNPPYGGKVMKENVRPFPVPSSKSQLLFLQHIMQSVAPGGLLDPSGRGQVLAAGGGVAGGMVVGEGEGDAVAAEDRVEDLADGEQGPVHGAAGEGHHPGRPPAAIEDHHGNALAGTVRQLGHDERRLARRIARAGRPRGRWGPSRRRCPGPHEVVGRRPGESLQAARLREERLGEGEGVPFPRPRAEQDREQLAVGQGLGACAPQALPGPVVLRQVVDPDFHPREGLGGT